MRIVLPQPDSSVVVENVSWREFQGLLDELGDHRSSRVAYDRGVLEIMSPSRSHERTNRLLALMIHTIADVRGIDVQGLGSWTLQREDLLRGVEPDSCFYVQSVSSVLAKPELDLARDPPPDLSIEVEKTAKSLKRLPIYAALGVPEIWRFHGDRLEFLSLEPSGEYRPIEESVAFPGIRPDDLLRFLRRGRACSDTRLVREFRERLRGRFRKG